MKCTLVSINKQYWGFSKKKGNIRVVFIRLLLSLAFEVKPIHFRLVSILLGHQSPRLWARYHVFLHRKILSKSNPYPESRGLILAHMINQTSNNSLVLVMPRLVLSAHHKIQWSCGQVSYILFIKKKKVSYILILPSYHPIFVDLVKGEEHRSASMQT